MRIVAFLGYLCFLFCGGGHTFYANTQSQTAHLGITAAVSESHQTKFNAADQFTLVIDDSDFDLEEEHSGGDEVKQSTDNDFVTIAGSLFKNWSALYSYFTHLNYYNKSLATSKAYIRISAPIYIKNRTLRI
ncbi:hypothetical protein EZL74_03655 [Flavobacterium silvisoli]|uniref:Uncharacterized protein n=1 Tax=Flavobacterium silvisoli TaxID=2529433 RepID=A0A4Q9Z1W5_9FLAO|nr:hypothetical protein [Flavobacterium silvisoli]TBX70283.1 hypothetical protein EZL74_03655 [Flavobacterium silvisoli]